MASRYERVLGKYQRAEKHIDDFNVAVDAFRDANSDQVGSNIDPHTGSKVYFVKSIPEVPIEICLIFGDALQTAKNEAGDFAKFTDFMRRLVAVPHSEIKSELEAEKELKFSASQGSV